MYFRSDPFFVITWSFFILKKLHGNFIVVLNWEKAAKKPTDFLHFLQNFQCVKRTRHKIETMKRNELES